MQWSQLASAGIFFIKCPGNIQCLRVNYCDGIDTIIICGYALQIGRHQLLTGVITGFEGTVDVCNG